jgi:RNA polymerase sigma factor (sigma-70 family)
MKQVTALTLHTASQAGLEEAILREKRQLLAFIRKRVRNEDDAADLAQDVFAQFVEAFPGIRDLDKITAWLFRAARNKITDLYRKKKAVPFSKLGSTSDQEDSSLGFADFITDLSQLPDELNLREQVWEALSCALEELPAEQREAFVEHELEGKSFEEMARKKGVTVNTLLSRKRYAVLHLREKMAGFYTEIMTY